MYVANSSTTGRNYSLGGFLFIVVQMTPAFQDLFFVHVDNKWKERIVFQFFSLQYIVFNLRLSVKTSIAMQNNRYSRTSHNAWLLSSTQVGQHAPCILHNAWCFDTKFVWYAVWGIQGPSIYGPSVSKHCKIVAKAAWLSVKIITSCLLVLLFLMPPEHSSHRLEVKCKPHLSHTPYKPLPMSSMHWWWNGVRW